MYATSHANRPGDSSSRPERSFRVTYTGPHLLRYSSDRPTGAPSSTTGHSARFPAIRKEDCFFSCPRCVSQTAGFSTVGTDCSTKAAFCQRQERTNELAVYAKASRSFPTGRSSVSFPCLSDQLNNHIRIALSTLESSVLFHFAPVLLVSLVKLWKCHCPFGTLCSSLDNPVPLSCMTSILNDLLCFRPVLSGSVSAHPSHVTSSYRHQ